MKYSRQELLDSLYSLAPEFFLSDKMFWEGGEPRKFPFKREHTLSQVVDRAIIVCYVKSWNFSSLRAARIELDENGYLSFPGDE